MRTLRAAAVSGLVRPAPRVDVRGRPSGLRLSFEAPSGRVVKGWVGGPKEPAVCGAAQVLGRSFGVAGGHQIDHQLVRAVLASRLARYRGQRSYPGALILPAMRGRHRGQIERQRAIAVRRWRSHRPQHPGHFPIRGFRLRVTVLQRVAVHPMRHTEAGGLACAVVNAYCLAGARAATQQPPPAATPEQES